MQYTLTSCPTPFNFGFPRYLVSKSSSLIIVSWILFDMAIPPGAENGSILAVTFTSSPMISFSFSNISPKWIPIRRTRLSISLDF